MTLLHEILEGSSCESDGTSLYGSTVYRTSSAISAARPAAARSHGGIGGAEASDDAG
jgi:hypothetical protein